MNDENELLAMVISLVPERSGRIRISNGRMIHAAFIAWVEKQDPSLAKELHPNDRKVRPFTLSSLRGGRQEGKEGFFNVAPGEAYWIRVTSLSGELTSWLLERADESTPPPFTLGSVIFQVRAIALNHKRAGLSSYRWMRDHYASCPLPDWFRWLFYSATAFRFRVKLPEGKSDIRNILLPLPALMFSSLYKRWNTFAPKDLHIGFAREDFINRIERAVMISQYDLKTTDIDFNDEIGISGFTGMCEYRTAKGATPEILRWALTLGCYSFYAGIGYRTTWGMGQVEFLLPE
ncbi:MAG: CRISPR-associated endoribonuclease Cas6 [Deltaproteobacteria bacterium]|nr:CRISPR-associated endoribonuclease Cas6 [Deltaproteobacteria bacterium]